MIIFEWSKEYPSLFFPSYRFNHIAVNVAFPGAGDNHGNLPAGRMSWNWLEVDPQRFVNISDLPEGLPYGAEQRLQFLLRASRNNFGVSNVVIIIINSNSFK